MCYRASQGAVLKASSHAAAIVQRFAGTYMSSGYTKALARTAPAEPAIALPHGGSASTFDWPAIAVAPRRVRWESLWEGPGDGETARDDGSGDVLGYQDRLRCEITIAWPRDIKNLEKDLLEDDLPLKCGEREAVQQRR